MLLFFFFLFLLLLILFSAPVPHYCESYRGKNAVRQKHLRCSSSANCTGVSGAATVASMEYGTDWHDAG
ncbi:hypothetical protein BDZ91DRAFT_714489 [Kalaharituber pfeilii]|nr:hypothetical protein BDZ91DRAFT_714489 [Kalaharituber pfeilii]